MNRLVTPIHLDPIHLFYISRLITQIAYSLENGLSWGLNMAS